MYMTKVYIIVGCEGFHKRGLLRVCTHLSLHAYYIQHTHRHAYKSNQKGPKRSSVLHKWGWWGLARDFSGLFQGLAKWHQGWENKWPEGGQGATGLQHWNGTLESLAHWAVGTPAQTGRGADWNQRGHPDDGVTMEWAGRGGSGWQDNAICF